MKLSDRRWAYRFAVTIPLAVRKWRSLLPEQRVDSLNLSKAGVYFATFTPLDEGTAIQVRLEMPAEVSSQPPAEWNCTGHIVRVDRLNVHDSLLGIGVRFDYYEIASPIDTAAADPVC